jgi:putative ubiquitin-RnfH superfamily antitoxin RatB of RatAB toxin-antitoxin module
MSWSRDAVSNQLPLSFQATFVTVFLWPYNVLKQLPDRGSHSFTKLSIDPKEKRRRRGVSKNTELIKPA